MNTKIRVMKKIGGASLVLRFGGGSYVPNLVLLMQISIMKSQIYKMYSGRFLGFDEKLYVIYFKDITSWVTVLTLIENCKRNGNHLGCS